MPHRRDGRLPPIEVRRSFWYGIVESHVLVKGRMGCLTFTARLGRKAQSPHRDQAVSEVRSTAAQIGTLDGL